MIYTPWFQAAKQDPQRIGYYHFRANIHTPTHRMFWNGARWQLRTGVTFHPKEGTFPNAVWRGVLCPSST